MNDPSNCDLPDVRQVVWSLEQVEACFSDLERHAQVYRVQIRSPQATAATAPQTTTLADALAALREQTATAVQVYYQFDEKKWCDTLMPTPDGIRVVRSVLPADHPFDGAG